MTSEKAKFKMICKGCLSKLTFENSDIDHNQNPKYITCPICGSKQYVYDIKKGWYDGVEITYDSDEEKKNNPLGIYINGNKDTELTDVLNESV